MTELNRLKNLIARMSEANWSAVKNEFEQGPKTLFNSQWWNAKYYEKEGEFVSSRPQKVAHRREMEVPVDRVFCHESLGRFALKGAPVSYWSNDYTTAHIEATRELRCKRGLTLADAIAYRSRHYLKALQRAIDPSIVCLDVRRMESEFFRCIGKLSCQRDSMRIQVLIYSRMKKVYPLTHEISRLALDHGFNGVLYYSVRGPKDFAPHTCLALFEERFVCKRDN